MFLKWKAGWRNAPLGLAAAIAVRLSAADITGVGSFGEGLGEDESWSYAL